MAIVSIVFCGEPRHTSRMPVKRAITQILIWTLIVTTISVSVDGSEHESDIKKLIIRREAKLWQSQSMEAITYDYNVSLALIDGFSAIEGRVDIELKLTGGCRDLGDSQASGSRSEWRQLDWSKQIIMFMNSDYNIDNLSLVVANTKEKLNNGLGEELELGLVLIDDDSPKVVVKFKQDLPANYYGKLSIAYSSLKAVQSGCGDEMVQLDRSVRDSFKRLTRIHKNQAKWLFPRIDEYKFSSGTNLKLTLEHTEEDRTLISNLPWDGRSILLKDSSYYMDFNLPLANESSLKISLNELVFALIPSPNKPVTHDTTSPQLNRPTIEASGDDSIQHESPYVGILLKLRDIMRKFAVRTKSYHRSTRADYLTIGQMKGMKKINTEMALTMALKVAREWFTMVRPESIADSWIIECLAGHYAIRMVRQLEPQLKVDEYVRNELLPWALEHETKGHYDEMRLAYGNGVFNYKLKEIRQPETNLLARIKAVAIINMLRRTFTTDWESFDGAIKYGILADGSGNLDLDKLIGAIKTDHTNRNDLRYFLVKWTQQRGYPYIGVSLDKQARQIRLDQVPIDWLDQEDKRKKDDAVWPIPIRIEFVGGKHLSKIVDIPIENGFDGRRDFITVDLPGWFHCAKHKFKLDLQDPQELPYYRVEYSADLDEMIKCDLKTGCFSWLF